MADEQDLRASLASLERLEEASRRTRPWLVLGLLGIIGGFVILVGYITRLHEQEKVQKEMWRERALRLQVVIAAYKESDRRRVAETEEPERRSAANQARELLDTAQSQTKALAQSTIQPSPAAPSSPTPDEAWAAASIAASNPALSIRALKALLARGFSVNGTIDGEQNRAIHLAAERCGDQVVAWLLSRGADPNIANQWKDTPLHIADVRCGGKDNPTSVVLRSRGARESVTQ